MDKNRTTLTLLATLLAICAGTAQAGKTVYNFRENLYRTAPPQEVMALPKFCWGRYVSKFKGPQYNISRDQCGPRANHYCQGLLRLNRGMSPMVGPSERASWISLGASNIEYTREGIKPYPACPIARHVQFMSRKVAAMRAAGGPAGSP